LCITAHYFMPWRQLVNEITTNALARKPDGT